MTTTERPRRGRGSAIGEGVTWAARWSLRLILVSAGAALLWLLIAQLWSIVLPVMLAVIVATVLWPPAAFLRRRKFSPLLAAATVLLAGIVVLAGLIALISASVAGGAGEIAESVTAGIQEVQLWAAGPPLNLAQSQLDSAVQQVSTQIQQSVSTIATSVLTGAAGVASGVVTGVLVLVLAFLFVKDGPRFLPWLRAVAGDGAGGHVAEVLSRVWKTVGDFIRTQAIVSLVDAILIGAGLLILGVPLALPIAVLTFLAGFVPIVGAIVAGAVGVLVALVSNGFTTALIVLALILVVQQVEGNVLQPILQSRSLGLHAAVVLLAVTAGSTLYGIAGAFLAVPVTAAAAVVLRYMGEQIDERVVGGAAPRVDPQLETIQIVRATPGAPSPDATVPNPTAADPAAADPAAADTASPDPAAPDSDAPDLDPDLALRDEPESAPRR
ncbi:MAG: AI-2E family transporter [Pseudonocardia sp.]|nr:AI-2E family transporter [Pseudonocardia sp.]